MTAGSPDPELIRRHIAALRGAVMRLRKYAGHGERELQADTDIRWAVERGLQIAIQNVLDVATHLCAAAGVDASLLVKGLQDGLDDLMVFADQVELTFDRR
ncbi:MAG: DUF86 domain-containing protein [Proteobacteria bacterium]|nr:DUF86 domain-containing protein [Pseudomonadota bacterium]